MPTHTQRLLDKARELCSPPTDYELAKQLGISKQTVSRCRRKAGTLDNEGIVRLARFLQQDVTTILPLIELDRAKDQRTRDFWEKLAPRVVPSLVIGILATAGGIGIPRLSSASRFEPQRLESCLTAYTLCEVARRMLRWLQSLTRASYRACHG